MLISHIRRYSELVYDIINTRKNNRAKRKTTPTFNKRIRRGNHA